MPNDPVPGLLVPRHRSCSKRSLRLCPAFEPAGSAADPVAIAQVLERRRPPPGRQLPLLPSSLCRADAQAAASVARAAYALAMKINPNNHARDGGRASSEMEIEAVREIAACSAGRSSWAT
jgi:tyrosine decarboxylase / aspartate 1-decarboxylase